MTNSINRLQNSPYLQRIVAAQLLVWPQHEDYLRGHFEGLDETILIISEEVAELVLQLAGERLEEFCEDYKWMCNNFIIEDVHFRKTGKYRWSNFSEAYSQIYSDHDYMSRYINGILFSQILWTNQIVSFAYYVNTFLPSLNEGDDLLEIGPGHGLLLYFAAKQKKLKSISAWDVSQSSISATDNALKSLCVNRQINLTLQNILDPLVQTTSYHAVVFSEVLEHLDYPSVALKNVYEAMHPGGRLFLNVPINSPAPDHIYLWNTPEEVVELVKSCGFEVESTLLAPATGFSEAQARKRKVTINTLIVAVRPK